MTDPTDPTEHNPEDARAEQAFRDALSERADTLEPASLSAGKRGRPWAWWAAGVAAVAVVAATATFAVVTAQDDVGGPDPSAATASEAPTPTATPDPGFRTVGYLGVAVDVPVDWADEGTPNPNGCDYPDAPFVAVQSVPGDAFTDQFCRAPEKGAPLGFPAVAPADWQPHVQVSAAASAAESLPDGPQSFMGWTLTRATVADVRVEVFTDDATADVGREIVDSVRTRTIDESGCDVTSPVQAVEFVRPPAFDLAQVASVTSIGVCLYSRTSGADTPGLGASRELVGADAQAELEALQAAPEGGGPDAPENCLADMYGDTALVLRLRDGDRVLGDVYTYVDWCFGNGFDDGTTKRAITADACMPLWGDRVQPTSFSGEVGDLCIPPR